MPAKENLVGKKFNQLTVLSEVPKSERKNPKKTEWLCQCDCGNTTRVITNYLKTGHTKSCGCWRAKNAAKLFTQDITGEKFNKLTAIEPTDNRGADGSVIWKCQCDCGNTHYASTNSLRNGAICSCGCLISKGEQLITSILSLNDVNFKKQYYFNDLKDKKYLYFDFAIFNNQDELIALIEYQGEQHYTDVLPKNWISPKVHDEMKRQYCLNNNIKLIEIPFTDYNILSWEYLRNRLSN